MAWMERQSSEPMKVSTMSRQLTAYSQSSAEGVAYFSEADELDDLFEVCDTPTAYFSEASVRNPSPGAGRAPRPPLPAPMKVNVAALLSRAAREQSPGPRAPQPAPAETEVFVGNLPRVYTEQMLLKELLDAGFRGGCDFGTLRLHEGRHGSQLGCSIRFNSVSARNAFVAAFQGRKMRESSHRVEDVVTVALAATPARPLGMQGNPAPAASQEEADPPLSCMNVPYAGKGVMYCQSCGGKASTASNFCCQCGTHLAKRLLLLAGQ